MEAYKFTGTLVFVGKIQNITGRSGHIFTKRDIAIVDDPAAQYPTTLVGTLKKSQKCDMTDKVSPEDVNKPVTVSFFPDGRTYQDKSTGEKKAIAGNTITYIEWGERGQSQDGDGVPAPAEPQQDSLSLSDVDDMPF